MQFAVQERASVFIHSVSTFTSVGTVQSWLFRITVLKCNSSVVHMVEITACNQIDCLGDKLCYMLIALSLFSMKWPLTLIL